MGSIGKLHPFFQLCLQTVPQRLCCRTASVATDPGVWTAQGYLKRRNVGGCKNVNECNGPHLRLPQGNIAWVPSVTPVGGSFAVSSSGVESTGSRAGQATYQRFFSQWSRGVAFGLEGYDSGRGALGAHIRQGDSAERVRQETVLKRAGGDLQSADVKKERELHGASESGFEPRSSSAGQQGQTEEAAIQLAKQMLEDFERGHADRVIEAFDPDTALAASPICPSGCFFPPPGHLSLLACVQV